MKDSGSWPPDVSLSGVSVVVPYFEAGEHLRFCVDAIRDQKFDHPVDILVVDDASQEQPASTLSLGDDVQIITLRANRGEAVARNVGLASACKSHVTFVDQDDFWGPLHLDRCAAASTSFPEAPCVAPSSTEIREPTLPDSVISPPVAVDVTPVSEFQAIAGGVSNTVFAPRDVLIGFGGFPTGMRGVGDYLLLTRLAQAGLLVRLNDPTYGYLRHEGMATHRYDMSRNVLLARLVLDNLERPSREPAWDVDLLSAFASRRPARDGQMAIMDALAIWRLRRLPVRTLLSIAKRVGANRTEMRRDR